MDSLSSNHGLVDSALACEPSVVRGLDCREVIAVDERGRSEVVVRHKSMPLCFDFLPDGTPLLVSGPRNAIVSLGADGTLLTYADLSGLSPHHSNDIVVDGRGNAYVNNPGYDPLAGPAPEAASAPGFVAVVNPAGQASVVADDLAFPNGMAVTADNATLLVAESHRSRLTAFDIGQDGRLSGRRVWADLAGDAQMKATGAWNGRVTAVPVRVPGPAGPPEAETAADSMSQRT